MKHLTNEQFLADVAKHEMKVLIDCGLFRHVRFAHPGTYTMSFGLVTWPGYLAYYGDMGEFVFQRLPDMFQFFRGHKPNLQYWAEKLCAHDRHGGHEQFSTDRLAEIVAERVTDFEEHNDLTATQKADLLSELDDVVLCSESYESALNAASSFKFEVSGGQTFRLDDLWDNSLTEYTFRFQWCCHALPWAIAKYDATPPRFPLWRPQW